MIVVDFSRDPIIVSRSQFWGDYQDHGRFHWKGRDINLKEACQTSLGEECFGAHSGQGKFQYRDSNLREFRTLDNSSGQARMWTDEPMAAYGVDALAISRLVFAIMMPLLTSSSTHFAHLV